MIHIYFLGTEAFVILGYFLGSALFPKRYPLIFYKFLGVTVFSLLVWYLSFMSGSGWTNMVPVALGILLVVIAIAALLFKSRLQLPSKRELLVFVGVELLSYVVYLFLVYIRTYKTDILGTEKLMDVALINALMKQNHIPIENPWFSGFYMNYYYFGHFVLALFQYLFQIPTAVGYNLAISLIGVWIVQAGYLVVKVMRFSDLPALLVSVLMTFGGNLYLLVQTLQHVQANQWFASATRVIPYTINEFPAYSIVLGDLHGHYLSYPFFLLGVFLLIDMIFPATTKGEKPEWLFPKSVLLGILLGYLYLTNSWDVFTLALLGGVLVVSAAWYLWRINHVSTKEMLEWGKRVALFIGLPVLVFSLPQFLASRSYYLPPVGGVGLNKQFSGLWEIFLLFGQFLIITVVAAILYEFLWKRVEKKLRMKAVFSPQILLPIVLIITGALLVIAVEFVYAKDIFSTLNPSYARTNTVFKIYYHVWSLFALGSIGFFLGVFWQIIKNTIPPRWLFLVYGAFAVCVAIMLSYSFISTDQYIAPNFSRFTLQRINDPRLSNGYSYMRDLHGTDYNLVSYLLTKPYAKILEIVTYDSYSYYSRISAYSGMSAVSGWPLHNVQWYNGYDGKGKLMNTGKLTLIKVSDRMTDIEKMYTSTDLTEVSELLAKYEVKYVVFSDQEGIWAKEKKKPLNTEVYKSLCRVDWQEAGATLFDCAKE